MNIEDIINKKKDHQGERFLKFGLSFNPFPKSGTANINESSDFTKALIPIDDSIHTKIAEYVADSLYSMEESDHKLICTVTGDYGTGKTQLLMYTKWLIQSQPRKAYVAYINNPGTKLAELIGLVIESIGQEQFKKYLWNRIIHVIKSNKNNYRDELMKFSVNPQAALFDKANPFSTENEANHKAFLESFLKQIGDKNKRKLFNEKIKEVIIHILQEQNSDDSVIADYFYNLVSEDIGINKTWETITSGSGPYLDGKVVKLLNAIIDIIQDQGFERFYLLVDEFEDITSGRLTKKEVDSYSHNLRTLIDKERRWCLLLAMTSDALKDLKTISPPLVDRLTDREIKIERLNKFQVKKIIVNYLNIARFEVNESLTPFTQEAVDYLNSDSNELPRIVLRRANYILERAADQLNAGDEITKEFVETQLKQ